MSPVVRVAWIGVPAALLLATAGPAASKGGAAGAYCPFPEKGETPRCLEPAVAEYEEFFSGLGDGEVSDSEAERLERDVASGASGHAPYLAISSLSYGYYRLAQRAATDAGQSPEIARRLERWNALLAQAYDVSADDVAYRAAVRQAAADLHDRAPAVTLQCVDERGSAVACTSTEVVLRGIRRAEDRVGLRGALENLLERIFGREDS